MGAHQIDNGQFILWSVSGFSAFFVGFIVLSMTTKMMRRSGTEGFLVGLVLGGLASLLTFHLVNNWMTKGGDIFSTDALTAAADQSRETVNGWLNPDHTELRPVGGNGMPVAPPSTEPRVIYNSQPPGPKVIPPNSVLARGRDSLIIPAPAPSTPPGSGRFVLACLRKSPLASIIYLEGDELKRFRAYYPDMAKVAAEMVSQPHPALVKPINDGAAIVLDGVAWDQSISKASTDKFDIHPYPAGTPQACKAGYEELGKFEIR
ncbi:hypothetical protein [Methylobacterium sp. WSM2598]|uniref:hypothetical protein n=1 Tax=Methylobacterium sp. WSM2598 TaxID=398261 RepID=UPI00037A9D39|nr:hypothetical protein [Methylobacterium sp. WSM2598]